MWNDIDLYHAVRDFTTDPVSFPAQEVGAFIQELVRPRARHSQKVLLLRCCQAANNQHYIPIVDAAVAKQVNASDIVSYGPRIPDGIIVADRQL